MYFTVIILGNKEAAEDLEAVEVSEEDPEVAEDPMEVLNMEPNTQTMSPFQPLILASSLVRKKDVFLNINILRNQNLTVYFVFYR